MSLKGIPPKYINKRKRTYTWHIKHPEPIKISYNKYITSLTYQQGPIKRVEYVKAKSHIFHYIRLANETLDNPFRIDVTNNKIIELSWHSQPHLKHAPLKIRIEPDGTIVIMWQAIIFSRLKAIFMRNVISYHDKHGNLLYLTNELPSGFAYHLDLISPNTYKVCLYHTQPVKQWVLNTRVHEKIIHV